MYPVGSGEGKLGKHTSSKNNSPNILRMLLVIITDSTSTAVDGCKHFSYALSVPTDPVCRRFLAQLWSTIRIVGDMYHFFHGFRQMVTIFGRIQKLEAPSSYKDLEPVIKLGPTATCLDPEARDSLWSDASKCNLIMYNLLDDFTFYVMCCHAMAWFMTC